MPLTSPAARARRTIAAAVAVTVGSFGLVALAPTAQAISERTTYACTGTLSAQLSVVFDTTAPARLRTGDRADVVVTALSELPSSVAEEAYGLGARRFDGTVVAQESFGGAATNVTHTIASTALPAQSPPSAVPFTASSAALPFTAPTATGQVAITAGDFVVTLNFYDSTGSVVGGGPVTLTCAVPPPGKPVIVDTITVVASSTTTLTLDRLTSEYGQGVTATAKVTTSAGTPDGDVAFSVDGLATSAKVGRDGVATLVLPDAGVGAHSVTATFVPRDASTYDGSATPPQILTVTRARTRLRVPVTGKTTKLVTRVGVKAKGAFDTVPSGTVRITLKRIGKAGKWVKVRTLDSTGAARAGFGRLKKGRYRATVVYRGDTQHLALTKTKKFRVARA